MSIEERLKLKLVIDIVSFENDKFKHILAILYAHRIHLFKSILVSNYFLAIGCAF